MGVNKSRGYGQSLGVDGFKRMGRVELPQFHNLVPCNGNIHGLWRGQCSVVDDSVFDQQVVGLRGLFTR